MVLGGVGGAFEEGVACAAAAAPARFLLTGVFGSGVTGDTTANYSCSLFLSRQQEFRGLRL
jgi:hypothetical protein